MALAAKAEFVDGAVVAIAVTNPADAPRRFVEQDVIGDAATRIWTQVGQFMEPQLSRPPAQGQRQIGAVAEGFAQSPKLESAGVVGCVGNEDRDDPSP